MPTLESPPAPTAAALRICAPPACSLLLRFRRRAGLGVHGVLRRLGEAARGARAAWLRLRAGPRLRAAAACTGGLRLCLGSGDAPLPGWTNVDLDGAPDVRLDLAQRLPIADGAAARIYSEHLIEHLDCEQGRALLRECRRVLAADGVLRVATPDLQALLAAYQDDWRDQEWVRWPGHEWIDTPARMLNQAFRGWGHRHLYDEQELALALRQAGFADVRRCDLGESDHGDLAGLETRADSKLILEARGRLETRP